MHKMAESCGKIVSNNANLQVENKPVEYSESVAENKTEAVMEPLLLEDYKEDTVPSSLQNLLKYFKQERICLDKNDTLAVFIYILMLETGFVPSEYVPQEGSMCSFDFHYKRLLLLTKSMPNNWRSNNTYKFQFKLLPFTSYTCSVTCVPVAEELVINCDVENIPDANFSILADPSLYIVSNDFFGTGTIYQNLPGFCHKFKTLVGLLCKNVILEAQSVRADSLLQLPCEIFDNIWKYCDSNSLSNLRNSCKYFRLVLVNRNLRAKRKRDIKTPKEKLLATQVPRKCPHTIFWPINH